VKYGKEKTMMRCHPLSRLALSATAAAILVACNTNDARGPQVASAPSDTPAPIAAAPAPSAEETAATPPAKAEEAPKAPLEASEGEALGPFVLTLRGPDKVPDQGEIELQAKIDAHKEFKVPATITVELPKGAKLTSGKDKESLASIPAGETLRTFKVAIAGKLEAPIKVIVDARDPAGAMGAHAERAFPEAKATYTRPSSKVPPPPVGRPGGPSR
jgi:hypothetical protein